MTIQADRIEEREREGIAYALRDMLYRAAFDDQIRSTAAQSLLAAVQHRAPAHLRRVIEMHGFAAYSSNLPERQELADHLKIASGDIAAEYLAELAAKIGQRRPARGMGAIFGAELPRRALRLCTGLKSALAGIL